MNAISFPLPPGYLTGQFLAAENAIADDPSPDCLLDLLLLADQLDAQMDSHLPPPPGNWEGLKDRVGAMLIHLLDIDADAAWLDRDRVWQPKMFRDALKSIPRMTGGDLLTLFIQSSETAYLHESEPMHARWKKVATFCRAEILRRIAAVASAAPAKNTVLVEYQNDEESLSVRDILRLAETSFKPDMPDANLLDLYLVVDDSGGPDEPVFDEIFEQVRNLLFDRLRDGAPGIDSDRHVEAFDPDEDEKALQALLGGLLSHYDLLTLYLVSFNNGRPEQTGDRWVAINSLCRAQILWRMSSDKQARLNQSEAIWRLVDGVNTMPSGDASDT